VPDDAAQESYLTNITADLVAELTRVFQAKIHTPNNRKSETCGCRCAVVTVVTRRRIFIISAGPCVGVILDMNIADSMLQVKRFLSPLGDYASEHPGLVAVGCLCALAAGYALKSIKNKQKGTWCHIGPV
jgi:hypothetical protein